ncbi:hypothetical protein D3C74_246860 [compost metagenome]
MPSAKERGDFLDHRLVRFLRHLLHARRQALADVIIQAHFLRHHVAFAQRIHAIEQLLRLLSRVRVGIRSEIFRFIFKHPPGNFQPGMRFIRYFNIRKSFVVLQQDIKPRMIFLDQVTLQNERLHVTSGHDVLEISDLGHEQLGFSVMTARKIGTNPVLQHFGFPDVNDRTFLVLHQVTTRGIG